MVDCGIGNPTKKGNINDAAIEIVPCDTQVPLQFPIYAEYAIQEAVERIVKNVCIIYAEMISPKTNAGVSTLP